MAGWGDRTIAATARPERLAAPADGLAAPADGLAAPADGLAAPAGQRLTRFSLVTRLVHWTTAALLFVLVGTAAALYLPSVATLVGRRETMKTIHVWSGLALLVPLIAGMAARGREPRLRQELRRLSRWDRADGRWLRTLGRDPLAAPGKFNAGQKLFAAFAGGALPSMLLTGSIMRWFGPFPLSWRTGATFVHDWLALALTVVVAGHVAKALVEPVALMAMVSGSVPARWAQRHRPRWYAELAPTEIPPPDAQSGSRLSVRDAPVRNSRRFAVAALAALALVGTTVALRPRSPAGSSSGSPGAVALAFEEAVDRADYPPLFDLAAGPYRHDLSREDFLAEKAADLLNYVDVKGSVIKVTMLTSDSDGDHATVTLQLLYPDGLEVPQPVGLARSEGRWKVVEYRSIGQGELVAACVQSRVPRQCVG